MAAAAREGRKVFLPRPPSHRGMSAEEIEFAVEETSTQVSGLFLRPRDADALYVLAHGAGAGMRHPFLEAMAERLGERGIATLRYQFPYMEEGRRYPNPVPLLEKTVRSAVHVASEMASGLPLVAGGKSLGARTAILVGEREWEAGKVSVKDLRTGEQTEVPLEKLTSILGGA